MIQELFTAFPFGANKERVAYYEKQTRALALMDLAAAVQHAALHWDQRSVPPLATLRRFAGAARDARKPQRIEPERAREVAMARLRARGHAEPDETLVWREFMQFGYQLGRYTGPASIEMQRAFAERWRQQDEETDRRIYGRVLDKTVQYHDEIALRVDPIREPTVLAPPRITRADKIGIWERQIRIALQEGAPEGGPRVTFLRRGLERAQGKRDGGPSDPLLDAVS